MPSRVAFSEIEETPDGIGFSGDSTAPRLEPATVTLRCRLAVPDDASLEALRYARRAMLREEWTLGVAEGEPSLEEAVFSAFEVSWSVRASERERGREKLLELAERANRALRSSTGRG
jgi:hypothetical protein